MPQASHAVQYGTGMRVTYPLSLATRESNLSALGEEPLDILIVGAGITGAGVAREAAMRGMRVALVDKEDFASGTSSRSSRLVHGGIRYLEHGELHLVYEASRERRILLRIAPHLVRPLQFLWPIFEKTRIPRWKLRAGFLLYDALALFRNIANHRSLDRKKVLDEEPALRQVGLRGGVNYFDAATDDIRLTIANVRAAAEAGAVVVNHLAVRSMSKEGALVNGVSGEDSLTGRSVSITARTVVNATGPWSDEIRRLANPEAQPSVRGTKGVHVAIARSRIGNNGALTLLSPIDGRVVFVLPAGRLTIIGTTESDYSGPPDQVLPTAADVTYLLRTANSFFPSAHLVSGDVISAWAGIRPLVSDDTSTPGSVSREHAVHWTAPGLLSVSGGKLTTYRSMAEDVVDEIARSLGLPVNHAPTARVPLPGGDMASFEEEASRARETIGANDVANHLVSAYGTEWRDVWAIVQKDNALVARVAPELPYIAAEIHWAVEHEMALTLADILVRRLHVAFETHDHGISAAPAVARVAAPLLGWTEKRIESELARYGREVGGIFGG
ncbi:MAG TPA: glycerol-3-phosphate dehydrogenase [Gemmatimonadaceae bacterium]|nr:glycerol-3-phosphate dehydrogenase [Gemmatimonadaceae bacterium]